MRRDAEGGGFQDECRRHCNGCPLALARLAVPRTESTLRFGPNSGPLILDPFLDFSILDCSAFWTAILDFALILDLPILDRIPILYLSHVPILDFFFR